MDHSDQAWELPGLAASGPLPAMKEDLMLFGRFVGDWEIIEARYPQPDGSIIVRRGRVNFRWILNGTAIQDVWSVLDERTGTYVPAGTTLRFYDKSNDLWRSVWVSPGGAVMQTFAGRKVGDRLVLEAQPDGAERWIFSDIAPGSFRWHAERTDDGGRSWTVTETMKVVRTSEG